MKNKKRTLSLLGLLFLSVISPTFSQNLVLNGDFESSSNGSKLRVIMPGHDAPGDTSVTLPTNWYVPTASGFNRLMYLLNASTADNSPTPLYPGTAPSAMLWSTNNGGVNTFVASPTGGNFMAMDGDSLYRGAIAQNLSGLVAGNTYQLDFDWAAAQLYTIGGATAESAQVNIGSSTFTTNIINNPSRGFSGWEHETFTFVADSANPVLSFFAVGTPSGLPPLSLLDGVSIVAVPETSSVMLMGTAIGAVMLRRRRK